MEKLDSAEIVSRIRSLSGLSQSQLAQRAGTSQPAVARYENGLASPSTATLQRLAKAGGFEIHIELITTGSSDLSTLRAKKLRQKRGEVLELIQRAGASNPHIFGSVARGEDNPQSDIDLLVDFNIDQGLQPIIELNRKLSALLKERVEVSPRQILRTKVLARALSEAVPL